MKRAIILGSLLVAVVAINTGCVSNAVLSGSKRQVALKRAVARGDDAAIHAIRNGEFVGLGIDVANLEALKERPLLQFGAALADAALMYGAYIGIKALEEAAEDDDETVVQQAPQLDDGAIIIGGDNSGKLDTLDKTVSIAGDNTGNINTGGDAESERIRATNEGN